MKSFIKVFVTAAICEFACIALAPVLEPAVPSWAPAVVVMIPALIYTARAVKED